MQIWKASADLIVWGTGNKKRPSGTGIEVQRSACMSVTKPKHTTTGMIPGLAGECGWLFIFQYKKMGKKTPKLKHSRPWGRVGMTAHEAMGSWAVVIAWHQRSNLSTAPLQVLVRALSRQLVLLVDFLLHFPAKLLCVCVCWYVCVCDVNIRVWRISVCVNTCVECIHT